MTITIDRIETTFDPTTYDPATLLSGERLLVMLRDAVATVAHVDPDELGSQLPAGRELLGLAGLARAAVAEMGNHSGTVVTEAPGVVVVRELVAATRMLASAIAQTSRA